MKIICTLFLTLLFHSIFSQSNNTDAIVRRSLDSVLRIQGITNKKSNVKNKINYQFSSTNSIAKQVYTINKSFFENNTILNSLVTTSCIDTSNIFAFKRDSTVLLVNNSKRLLDNSILILGVYDDFHFNNEVSAGFAIKASENGDIIWANYYDTLNRINEGSHLSYYQSMELADGNIVLVGYTTDNVSGNDLMILTKINSIGNVIWNKIFRSRLWGNGNGSTDYFYVQDCKQDLFDPNFAYLTGPNWEKGRNIIKLNLSSGNIVWSNFYQQPFSSFFDTPIGIDIKSDHLISFGRFNNNYNTYSSCIKINKLNGDTISTKIFTPSSLPFKFGFTGIPTFSKKNNGNYLLGSPLWGSSQFPPSTNPLYQAGIVELDSNLNFVNAVSIRSSVESNFYNTKITPHEDGTAFFTMLEYISGYTANLYQAQLINNVIIKKRKVHTVNRGMPYETPTIRINNGDLSIRNISDSIQDIVKLDFTKIHYSDTTSLCFGEFDSTLFTEPYQLVNHISWLDSIGSNVFYEIRPYTIAKNLFTLGTPTFECTQTNYCDSVKLLSAKNIFCPFEPIIVTARKNIGCGSAVQFNLQIPNLQSFTQVNDTTFKFIFNAPWQGKIVGSIYNSCVQILDSIPIVINSTQNQVNLGSADTIKCYNSSIVLNAKSGFKTYTWQDGSTDSIFVATQPGLYYVTVTSFCDNSISSDTIEVANYPFIALSAGGDLEKCNKDTVTINATAGFTNYSWLPNYNILNISSFNPKVFPFIDTFYRVQAKDSYNCTLSDTVKITVKNSPTINLGTDKYLCTGDSITLNVPNIFDSYLWNTGSILPQIKVFSGGMYSVIGSYANGCNSYDTINILAKNNPVVNLNSTNTICIGNTKLLDAGNFSSYLWEDGSILRQRSISSLGIYYVTVTDNFDCKGSDTVKITTYGSTPSNFLPFDSTKCSYNNLTISPIQNYTSYLWNTNVTTKDISIQQSGLYWLQVKDINDCIGKDSINIYNKDCLRGLYTPNAFTPNNDNKNDIFKPQIFGNLLYYEFYVFDRYGKQVFYSKDINKSWDGRYNGQLQKIGTYVWLCKYKISGQNTNEEKGTVILIR